MNDIKFDGCNKNTYKVKGYSIPVVGDYYLNVFSEEKEVVTCWELTLTERIKLLFGGKLWAFQPTYGKRPVKLKIALEPEELYPKTVLPQMLFIPAPPKKKDK